MNALKCPDCDGPLKRKLMMVKVHIPFASPERKRRLEGTRRTRPVHVCTSCGQRYILTWTLKKI